MSRYGHSQPITRQFTEAESAVDDRVTSMLTAPPLDFNPAAGIGRAYEWLKEDMQLRSALSGQLAQEQRMSYSQSERHDLARQAEVQQKNDEDAVFAIRDMTSEFERRKTEDPNARWEDVEYDFYRNNPDKALNPRIGQLGQTMRERSESPVLKQTRIIEQKNKLMDLTMRGLDMDATFEEYEKNPEKFKRDSREIHGFLREAAKTNAALEPELAEMNRIMATIGLKEAERRKKEDELHGHIGGKENLERDMLLTGRFSEMGLDMDNASGFVFAIGGSKTHSLMVEDVEWMKDRFGAPGGSTEEQEIARAEFREAAEIIGSGDDTHTPAEKRKAMAVVNRAASAYYRENREMIRQMDYEKQVEELSKEMAGDWKGLNKDINTIKLKKSADVNDTAKMEAMLSTYTAQLALERGKGIDDLLAPRIKEAAEKMSMLSDKNLKGKERPTVAQVDQMILAGTINFLGEASRQRAINKMTPSTLKKTAEAVDESVKAASPYGDVVERDGKTYDWNGRVYVARP